jgi:hypothetical protein
MDKQKEKQILEQKQTPIIDGDARPDMLIDADEIKKTITKEAPSNQKKSLTHERSADINSLEDFKDTK